MADAGSITSLVLLLQTVGCICSLFLNNVEKGSGPSSHPCLNLLSASRPRLVHCTPHRTGASCGKAYSKLCLIASSRHARNCAGDIEASSATRHRCSSGAPLV